MNLGTSLGRTCWQHRDGACPSGVRDISASPRPKAPCPASIRSSASAQRARVFWWRGDSGPDPRRRATRFPTCHSTGNCPRRIREWGIRGFTTVERCETSDLTPYQRLMRQGSDGQPTDRRVARHRPATVERFQKILATCPPGICLRPADRERLGIGKRSTTPLDGCMPAPTITTLPDDLIHYSEPRTMSVREHARLQSFPDWFSFHGPYTAGGLRRRDACPRYTQVGNAVPPLLAEALGETLVGLLADQQSPQVTDTAKVGQEVGSVALELVRG